MKCATCNTEERANCCAAEFRRLDAENAGLRGQRDDLATDVGRALMAMCLSPGEKLCPLPGGEPERALVVEASLLRAEYWQLKSRIEAGQAAHAEERAARDWLARENAKLRGELARAPCRWHRGHDERDECSEAHPCITHYTLSGATQSEGDAPKEGNGE